MLAQLAALAICTARVPLSRSFPQPVEDAAGIAVATVQIVLAITLAPALLANFRAAVRALAGGSAVTCAAAGLAHLPLVSTWAAFIWIGLWLIALINNPRWLNATLAVLAIGGTVAAYAGAEAGVAAKLGWIWEIAPPLSICPTLYHPAALTSSFALAIAVPGAIISLKLLLNWGLRVTGRQPSTSAVQS